MYFKNILKIFPCILLLICIVIPVKGMAQANFNMLLNQVWSEDCGYFNDGGVYFTNTNQVIRKIYFQNGEVYSTLVLGRPAVRGNILSYDYTNDAGEKGVETLELLSGGYRIIGRVDKGIQQIKNGKWIEDNSELKVIGSCASDTALFKDYEKATARFEKSENLRKTGYFKTNVIDLIVGSDQYMGKKVFLKCWVNLVDKFGGNCRSEDDSQFIGIDPKGIDKDLFKWLLVNCQNRFATENNANCKTLWVTGTVAGSSIPRLENVRYIDY